MNFNEASQFLVSLYDYKRREYLPNPEQCEWYLKRTQRLLDFLGNPEKRIPHYIHVTGTSGKGSVTLMLGSILKSAGKKTATFTSPSPSGVMARFEINGKQISKNDFAIGVQKTKIAFDKLLKEEKYDAPSYFEFLTAVALFIFAKKKVKWAVMEAGLGGRYDSTNVIPHKDIAVITNVGLDHAEVIGPTKEKIAYEKAGIVKKGAKVFTMEGDKKILSIIENECKKQKAFLEISNIEYKILNEYPNYQILNGVVFSFGGNNYHLPTLGEHQVKNATLCIEIAKSLEISTAAIKKGLATIKLPLRMEVISKNPLIILDGAHNPDKMKTTLNSVRSITINLKSKIKNLKLLVGFSADKNIHKMIKQLTTLRPISIACTRFTNNPHRDSAEPIKLAAQFKKILPESKIKIFNSPMQAFNWSLKNQKRSDLLLVTGSIFLSGELRPLLKGAGG